jgi:hypothetical protein
MWAMGALGSKLVSLKQQSEEEYRQVNSLASSPKISALNVNLDDFFVVAHKVLN